MKRMKVNLSHQKRQDKSDMEIRGRIKYGKCARLIVTLVRDVVNAPT